MGKLCYKAGRVCLKTILYLEIAQNVEHMIAGIIALNVKQIFAMIATANIIEIESFLDIVLCVL
jgi:hypothetical protein